MGIVWEMRGKRVGDVREMFGEMVSGNIEVLQSVWETFQKCFGMALPDAQECGKRGRDAPVKPSLKVP